MSDFLAQTPKRRPHIRGHSFSADLDVAEIDEKAHPGPTWSARAATISRSHLVVLSRRMTYPSRYLLVAVHLVDDRPVPLLGKVTACDYDGEGLYHIVLELVPIPTKLAVEPWIASLTSSSRGHRA
jgi:hypothetical protein